MIKAKKSLGQNFLIDENILKKIVNITNIKNKNVLEIGPGTGNLTYQILSKAPKKFIVIEKDKNLAINLMNEFKDKIEVINKDILLVDEKNLDNDKFIVFGNLPYNISTQILSKWVLNLDKKKFWFSCLILMFQKEVADRIISKFNSSKYGRISILSNWKLDVKKICDIKSNSFSPKPKVNSSLIYFKPKQFFFDIDNPKNLEKITRIFLIKDEKWLKNLSINYLMEILKLPESLISILI